jgi:type IV pilus assembly protein PilV
MRKQFIARSNSAQQGVALIEALIAILIFSIGVLGIVGMQANMIKNTSESQYRANAGYFAQQQIGRLWADSDNLPADLSTTTTPEPLLPNGTVTVTRTGKVFTITVDWQQPGEQAHVFTTNASIVGEGINP